MPAIHVCSLTRLYPTVAETGASHVLTLINEMTPVAPPPSIAPENYLYLGMNDIIVPIDGMTPPGQQHVESLLAFVRRWDQAHPMVIHCFAGISRSTAAAFIATCALRPDWTETEIATELRSQSPTATPNIRLVRLADELLGSEGRMVSAIEAIGSGNDAYEGHPIRFQIAER
jgi:predicted protein tyrosine phosphatase